MMIINDEMLNKYIDGELDKTARNKLEEEVSNSPELRKKLNLLKSVHNNLKQLKEYQLNESFTSVMMAKIKKGVKQKREQNYFVMTISMIFILLCLGILGYVGYEIIRNTQPADYNLSFKTVTNTAESLSHSLADLIKKNFTLIGSIISLGILISAYFFFESQKKGLKV